MHKLSHNFINISGLILVVLLFSFFIEFLLVSKDSIVICLFVINLLVENELFINFIFFKFFANGLSRVVIAGPAPEEGEEDPRGTFTNYELAGIFPVGAKSGFAFIEAEAVSEVEKLRSDLDYVAMMVGIEL